MADPDPQISGEGGGGGGGGGGGLSDPDIRGGGPSQKTIFSALRASVWSKDKGGRTPGPLLWTRH